MNESQSLKSIKLNTSMLNSYASHLSKGNSSLASCSASITPMQDGAMHEPNALGYAPNEPALVTADHANVVHLAKMCKSFFHQMQSAEMESASMESTYQSDESELNSNTSRYIDSAINKARSYSSIATSAVSQVHHSSLEVDAVRSTSAQHASSASDAIHSLAHAGVSRAADSLIKAVSASMDANHSD